jgi:hypothetical protein
VRIAQQSRNFFEWDTPVKHDFAASTDLIREGFQLRPKGASTNDVKLALSAHLAEGTYRNVNGFARYERCKNNKLDSRSRVSLDRQLQKGPQVTVVGCPSCRAAIREFVSIDLNRMLSGAHQSAASLQEAGRNGLTN